MALDLSIKGLCDDQDRCLCMYMVLCFQNPQRRMKLMFRLRNKEEVLLNLVQCTLIGWLASLVTLGRALPQVCVCVCASLLLSTHVTLHHTGHYVSDVFSNVSDGSWYSYNDSVVTPTTEATVRQSRKKSGYIFFYLHK